MIRRLCALPLLQIVFAFYAHADFHKSFSAITPKDRAETIIDGGKLNIVGRLQDMEHLSLMTGRTAQIPWSGYYWPVYQGLLGYRYSDLTMPRNSDWKQNFEYTFRRPATIDGLSPAEKYDLVVGDNEISLTKAMWREGQRAYSKKIKIPTWMGICQGRAAAATIYPAPQHSVTVIAADGHTAVKFYPSDLKALASLLVARAVSQNHVAGLRCEESTKRTRATEACLDTNPGTWHLSVVNQVGRLRRSLIMDAATDYEVWNEPVYSYSYTYFNPATQEPAQRLLRAMVDRAHFDNDSRRQYRSSESSYIVGVAMDVTYSKSSPPNHREDFEAPIFFTERYVYDLELDSEFNILGGEWHSEMHPDFLWTFPQNMAVTSDGDKFLQDDWNGQNPVPHHWVSASQISARQGQPLAKIVNRLLALSL